MNGLAVAIDGKDIECSARFSGNWQQTPSFQVLSILAERLVGCSNEPSRRWRPW
jgi:hypothetical protein